jgi:hypothetical protein
MDDSYGVNASASFGALEGSGASHGRQIAVDLRVGNHGVDDTRPGNSGAASSGASLDDDLTGLRTDFWQLADDQYKASNRDFYSKKAYLESRPKDKDRPDDFSHETPSSRIEDFSSWNPDPAALEKELRRASARFAKYPELSLGFADAWGTQDREYLLDTEGSRAAMEFGVWMMTLSVRAQAPDGSPVWDEERLTARSWEAMPRGKDLEARADRLAEGLMKLRQAKEEEPYSGPVLLSAQAGAVFIHQVLGHLLTGENQKDENGDQELKDKLGEQILPKFISLDDDPSLEEFQGQPLFGHYVLDDQAVPAQRVSLVEDGVLTGYLMSRSPVKGFPKSNGHGHSDTEHRPMGRLAVFRLTSKLTYSPKELKALLLKECKAQDKPYGFRVRRFFEQETPKSDHKAFRLIPAEIYRVDAASGRETLVRGAEVVGTALNALGRLKGTGEDPAALNTLCDYASGNQVISVVCPSLLFSELELQRSDAPKTRLKILKPPFAAR